MHKILLFWDHSDYLEHLKSQLEQQGFSLTAICSASENAKPLNLDNFDLFVILTDLNWETDQINHNGFSVARQLRQKHALQPILFCSFFQKEFILRKDVPLYTLLKTPCHYFLQLPFPITDFKEYLTRKLSPAMLKDILYYSLSPIGQIEEIMHQMKNKVYDTKTDAIAAGFEEIRKYLPRDSYPLLHTIQKQLVAHLQSSNESMWMSLVTKARDEILTLIPRDSPRLEAQTPAAIQVPWYVLLIDDDRTIREKVSNKLHSAGLNCITAASGEEAFAILETDYSQGLLKSDKKRLPRNSITVVISDLRFLNGEGDWDYYQGYEIINYIYRNRKNLVSFFMLTSKRGSVMQAAHENHQNKVYWYVKEDLEASASVFRHFCDQVAQEGNSIYEALLRKPREGYWTSIWKSKIEYPLMEYYRYHRMSATYHEKEAYISDLAEDYIRQAEFIRESRYYHEIQAEKLELMTGMKKLPFEDEKIMEKFYTKLVGRRIVIGLYLKGWNMDDIASILRNRNLKEEVTNIKNLFNSYLALPLELSKDISANILIEEKEWAERYLGISFHSANKVFFFRLTEILRIFQEILGKGKYGEEFEKFFEMESVSHASDAQYFLSAADQLIRKHPTYRDELLSNLAKIKEDPDLWQCAIGHRLEKDIISILGNPRIR